VRLRDKTQGDSTPLHICPLSTHTILFKEISRSALWPDSTGWVWDPRLLRKQEEGSSTRPNHRLELKAVLRYSFPLNACFLLIYSQFIRFLHPCSQLAACKPAPFSTNLLVHYLPLATRQLRLQTTGKGTTHQRIYISINIRCIVWCLRHFLRDAILTDSEQRCYKRREDVGAWTRTWGLMSSFITSAMKCGFWDWCRPSIVSSCSIHRDSEHWDLH